MIIWRGMGFLALIVAMVMNTALQVATDGLGIPEGFKHYRDAHGWVWILGMGLSAAGCWFLGKWLEAREVKNGKVVIDKESGQEIRLIRRHDMFWIPVKWWAVIWAVVGVWIVLAK